MSCAWLASRIPWRQVKRAIVILAFVGITVGIAVKAPDEGIEGIAVEIAADIVTELALEIVEALFEKCAGSCKSKASKVKRFALLAALGLPRVMRRLYSRAVTLVDYAKLARGVARITLSRVEALNAINLEMRDLLWEFVRAAVLDPDVRALVFSGAGARAFSAGADISEFGSAPSLDAAREARRQRDLWGLLEEAPLPTVAALHGFCFGAGIELPLYCDLRLAAPDTRIALPEVTLGYIPSAGGTQLMPRVGAAGAAAGLILGGEPIDAERALAWGIVHRIVPLDELEAAALAAAERLAAADGERVAALKRSIRRGLDLPLEAAIAADAQTATRLRSRITTRQPQAADPD